MTSLKRSCLLVALVSTGVACHKRPPAIAPAAPPMVPPTVQSPSVPARPASPVAASGSPTTPVSEEELFRRKSLDELNSEHPLTDAFFDYNDTALRADAREALQRDAAWLSKWPQTTIRIDGHCDERGTAEYNLVLGERRAAMVQSYLQSLGVSPSRIRAVSLGKESPFCRSAADDGCWAQNRRGHLIITAK